MATYTGTATNAGEFFGVFGAGVQNGAGAMPLLSGVAGQVGTTNAGIVISGAALDAVSPNIQGSGAVTTAYGLYVSQQGVKGRD